MNIIVTGMSPEHDPLDNTSADVVGSDQVKLDESIHDAGDEVTQALDISGLLLSYISLQDSPDFKFLLIRPNFYECIDFFLILKMYEFLNGLWVFKNL